MKKISILTTYPLVEEPVIKNRLLPFISCFIDKGYKVDVYQPYGEILRYSDSDHLCIRRVEVKQSRKTSFIFRALFEIVLCFKILREYKKNNNHDSDHIVLITIPSMFLTLILPFIKSKIKLLDVRDLTWEYLSDNNIVHFLFKKAFKCFFKINAKLVTSISVTNRAEMDYIYSLDLDGVSMVTNGISNSQYNKLSSISINDTNKRNFTITYVGNVGLAQDLSILVQAAIDNPSYQFNIIGGGNDLDRIKTLVKEKSIDNVFISGRVNWEEVSHYYTQSHVLFAQLRDGFDTAIPSKLYEYLSVGRYVVFGGGLQVKAFLSEFDGVEFISPSDIDSLNNALRKIYKYNGELDFSKNKAIIKNNYIREDSVNSYVAGLNL